MGEVLNFGAFQGVPNEARNEAPRSSLPRDFSLLTYGKIWSII